MSGGKKHDSMKLELVASHRLVKFADVYVLCFASVYVLCGKCKNRSACGCTFCRFLVVGVSQFGREYDLTFLPFYLVFFLFFRPSAGAEHERKTK